MTTTFGRRAFLKGAAAAGALACGPFILRRPALGKNGLRSVDDALSQAVESKAMPGVVVVAATDKAILYEGAFGKRELGKEAPMTADTVVWIASMTKAITATAAMQLIERGKLSLEQPASEVVPDIAAARVLEGFDASGKPRLRAPKRPITLKHLLTHTAGFGYDMGLGDWRVREGHGYAGDHHMQERRLDHSIDVRSG